MTSLLFRWLLNTVALVIVVNVVPGFSVASLPALLISSLVLGLLNAIVRPLLFWLTLPLTIVTLGLFLIVLNALMLEMTDWIVGGFSIASFWSALVGAIVLSLISLITNRIGGDEKKKKRKKKA
jgi:putative membrane protein